MLKALVYAYVLGGLTFLPLVLIALVCFALYTSVPVGDPDPAKDVKASLEEKSSTDEPEPEILPSDIDDRPKTRKGWLVVRRTFEETEQAGSYAALVRGFLDSHSKDPKRSRPKDMWYVVLKGKVLYLYEDESMQECEAAIELGGHEVIIYPEGLPDAELFTKRSAICLRPRVPASDKDLPSVTREMRFGEDGLDQKAREVEQRPTGGSRKKERRKEDELEKIGELKKERDAAREEALDKRAQWFIFVRSNVEMEDWYLALVHASDHAPNHPMLEPLSRIFQIPDMDHLVSTLDEQPDVIPTRWLNALIGRLFFSFYRTQRLETGIINRLMKKLSKVKRPSFLSDVVVTQVSVGNRPPSFSKPMLKELTKEGDAAIEVRLHFKGEVRITAQATATIDLGTRFKKYQVKLVLAAVLREIEGNLLIKVKRPPSNRIWYAFTQMPKLVLDVEPVVSDRQITWGMILGTIESRLKEIIMESIVLPNMDDIAFFESSAYDHRGGIWADASRTETSPEDETVSTEVPGSMNASMPALTDPPTQVEDDPGVRAQSPESVALNDRSQSLPATTEGEITAGETVLSSTNKRKSWFASLSRGEGSVGASETSPVLEEDSRGRTMDSEQASTSRSQSTPADKSSAHSINDEIDSPDEDESLHPRSIRRSASQHSRSTGQSSRSSTPERDDASRPRSTPSTPLPPRIPSMSSGPMASGFLNTLKSRDKQAIQAQAKEAMRKWGVGWGSLRRNSLGEEESPDGGPNELQRADSHVSTNSQSSRPTFAELRAKVKDRRASRQDGELLPSGWSAPIAIPQSARTLERIPSHGGRSPSFSGGLSTSAGSSGSRAGSDVEASPQPTKYVAPSLSRTTTQLQTASQPELPRRSVSPQPSPAPIHTQPPQAKTMMIPGIHASHRNEVQSLGYVAPTPAPDPKGKGPALQTVVNRLWKRSQQEEGVEPRSTASSPDEPSSAGLSEPTLGTSRPGPPPLPPRSASGALKSIPSMAASEAKEGEGRSGNGDGEPDVEMVSAEVGLSAGPPPLPPRRTATTAA